MHGCNPRAGPGIILRARLARRHEPYLRQSDVYHDHRRQTFKRAAASYRRKKQRSVPGVDYPCWIRNQPRRLLGLRGHTYQVPWRQPYISWRRRKRYPILIMLCAYPGIGRDSTASSLRSTGSYAKAFAHTQKVARGIDYRVTELFISRQGEGRETARASTNRRRDKKRSVFRMDGRKFFRLLAVPDV